MGNNWFYQLRSIDKWFILSGSKTRIRGRAELAVSQMAKQFYFAIGQKANRDI
jgi:hypothetical protein